MLGKFRGHEQIIKHILLVLLLTYFIFYDVKMYIYNNNRVISV